MDMKEYLKQSARTAAGGDMDRKDFPTDKQLAMELIALDTSGRMADALKRNLFYSDDLHKRVEGHRLDINEMCENVEQAEDFKFTADKDIIHAMLGIMSEAAEISEEIVKSAIEQRQPDFKNLGEECGDNLWYTALLLRAIRKTFEQAGGDNIAKLKKRFPDKFSKDKAIYRDVEEEQKVLSN